MIHDMSDVIAELGGTTYDVTRRAASTTAGGRVTPGASSQLQILAAVQPLNGRETDRLPEFLRSREVRQLFTATELRAAGSVAGADADVVSIGGLNWEVSTVEAWHEHGGFYRVLVSRTGR